MSSLSRCLVKASKLVSKQEAAMLRRAAKEYVAEGYPAREAGRLAVADALDDLRTDLRSILDQVGLEELPRLQTAPPPAAAARVRDQAPPAAAPAPTPTLVPSLDNAAAMSFEQFWAAINVRDALALGGRPAPGDVDTARSAMTLDQQRAEFRALLAEKRKVWEERFNRLAPGLRQRFRLEFGTARDLVRKGRVSESWLTGTEEAAYDSIERMLFLFDTALVENTDRNTLTNLLHEMAHAHWTALPQARREELTRLWHQEKDGRKGPLYKNGQLIPGLAQGVETDVKEWYAERLAIANRAWAQRKLGIPMESQGLLGKASQAFRHLLQRLKEYIDLLRGNPVDLDFKQFLNTASATEEELRSAKGGSMAFSVRSYRDNEGAWAKKFIGNAREAGWSNREAQGAVELIESVVKVFEANPDVLPNEGKVHSGTGKPVPALQKNADFKFTLDVNRLCKRVRQFYVTVDAVQARIGRPMNEDEFLRLSQVMRSHGDIPGCIYCYVEASRRAAARNAYAFVTQNTEDLLAQLKGEETGLSKRLPERDALLQQLGWSMADFGRWVLDRERIVAKSREAGSEGDEGGAEARLAWMYNKYVQASKGTAISENGTYTNELLTRLSDEDVKETNERAGLRWLSATDFDPTQLVDTLQAMAHATIRGLAGHEYTKEPYAALILGDTGMKQNLSIALNEDPVTGRMVDDVINGMPHDVALRLRARYKNAGTMLMMKNLRQLLWGLSSPDVDMGIPHHAANWSGGARKYGIFGLDDFSKVQHERWLNPKTAPRVEKVTKGVKRMVLKSPKDHFGNKLWLSYWLKQAGGSEKKAVQLYLKFCAENGLRPKFSGGRYKDGSTGKSMPFPNLTTHPGYVKLLKDYARTDSPQTPLDVTKVDRKRLQEYLDRFIDSGGWSWRNESNPATVDEMVRLVETGQSTALAEAERQLLDQKPGVKNVDNSQSLRISSWKPRTTTPASTGDVRLLDARPRGEKVYQYTAPHLLKAALGTDPKPAAPAPTPSQDTLSFARRSRNDLPGQEAKGFRDVLREWFTSAGNLPPAAFQAKLAQEGRIAATMKEASFALRDLDRAVHSVYGGWRRITPAEVEVLNTALGHTDPAAQAAALATLAPELQTALGRMRDQIDLLSNALIQEDAIQGDVVGRVAFNLGLYLNRSFRKFDDPEWARKVPQPVINRAVNFIRAELEAHAAASVPGGVGPVRPVTDGEVHGYVSYLLNKDVEPIAFYQPAKGEGMDLRVLKPRQEIPQELLDLMGEYKDPRVNFARSVAKTAALLEQHRYLQQLRQMGQGRWLFTRPINDATGNYDTLIAGEDSQAMRPLAGLYTTREIAQALAGEKPPADTLPMTLWLRANSWAKIAKTVLSPMTQVRNFAGNFGFLVANGHYRADAVAQVYEALRADFGRGDAAAQAYLARLARLGVVGESVAAGEIREALQDAGARMQGFTELLESPAVRAAKLPLRAAARLYQVNDEIFKIYAFENERRSWLEAGLSAEEADRVAAERVRNTLPTYRMIPKAAQKIRRFGLTGSFVSFPAEVIRTTYHTFNYLTQDLQSDNPAIRAMGYRRLAGVITMASAAGAASALSRWLAGISADDEEDLRRFLPAWNRNATLYFRGHDGKGRYKLIDVSYLDPWNVLKKPLTALLNGEDWQQGIAQGAVEMLAPFGSEGLVVKLWHDLARNQDDNGRAIYNRQDTIDQQAAAMTGHVWRTFEPGAITQAKRIIKAAGGKDEPGGRVYNLDEEIMAVMTGARAQSLDVGIALANKAARWQGETRGAELIYRQQDRPGVAPEVKAAALARAEKVRKALFDEMYQDVLAAQRLRLTPSATYYALKQGGLEKKDAGRLQANIYVPFQPAAFNYRQFYQEQLQNREDD